VDTTSGHGYDDRPAGGRCIVEIVMYDDNRERVDQSAVSPRTGCYIAMGQHS